MRKGLLAQDTHGESTELDAKLSEMRQEKVSRKLFYLKKVIQRAVKKARTFSVQKIIKKIKATEQAEKKSKLEEQMKSTKQIDLTKMSAFMLKSDVLEKSDLVKRRLASHKDIQALESLPRMDTERNLIWGNALEKALSDIRSDLERFIEDTFEERRAEPKTRKSEEPGLKRTASERSKAFNGADDNVSSAEEQEQPQRKNRKGQRARRQEWEQKYGKEAHHLSHEPVTHTSQSPSPSEPKLHPSWEAKKKMKEAIVHSAGMNKKIKFDEDD